jgi:hypothetical protein
VTRSRRGPLLAGIWLVGLGVVLAIRQALALSWGEAWPLFVVLVGAASLASSLLNGVRGVAGLWSLTWPVLWIAVGVALFLSTTNRIGAGPMELIGDAWPWIVVGLGVWFLIGAAIPGGRARQESLVIPLGDASTASIRIRFGAGELFTQPASPGHLVDGSFVGGVASRQSGPGRIELEQDTTDGLPWLDRAQDWRVGLTTEVPVDLRLETGAARCQLDLTGIRLRTLELQTGASDTRIRLPRGAGATTVKAEIGAASLVVEVPTGVAARIRTRMALGSSQVDETAFPRNTDRYLSADYDTAVDRVDLDLQGGVGSIRVVTVD